MTRRAAPVRCLVLGVLVLAAAPLLADAPRDFAEGRSLLESGTADDARRAAAVLHRALEGYRREGNAGGAAETLYALAVAHGFAGELAHARRLSREAIDVHVDLADRRGEAAARDHLGGLLAGLGETREARSQLEAALRLRRSLPDRGELASSLHNLASLHLQTGEASSALELLDEALSIHRELGVPAAVAAGLNNLGLLWLHLGRFEPSRLHLEEALELHGRLGDDRRRAGTLNNLGLLAWRQSRWRDAHRFFGAALELRRAAAETAGMAETLGNLGLVEIELGNFTAAGQHLDKALELAGQARLEPITASHLASRGRLELRRGQPRRAMKTLEHALGSPALEPLARSVALLDLARAHRALGAPRLALGHIREAIAGLETLRSKVDVGRLRAYFLAPHRHFYDFEIDLLMHRDEPRRAVGASEKARARTLLDLLRLAGPPARRGLPVNPQQLDLEGLRGRLDGETTVLVFHVSDPEGTTGEPPGVWAWTLDTDGLAAFDLGSAASLESLARDLYHHLSHSRLRAHRGPARLAAERLAEALLGPMAGTLRRRLVVVPDGALHRLPFAVLPGSEGEPLGHTHVVSYAPSLAVLEQLRRRGAAARSYGTGGATATELRVFADPIFQPGDPRWPAGVIPRASAQVPEFPRLPASGLEARRIAALFPAAKTRLQLGTEATKKALMKRSLGTRRLHLATHAVIDDRWPERSGLALSSVDSEGRVVDGMVRLEDLFKLETGADLVTLSACRSALGPRLRGEGLISLSRGFFRAGARQLVVSLWDVDDRATAELMEHFYRALGPGGLGTAEALAEAQRQMRSDPRWNAPFYWASFVMLGDWR